MGRQISRSLLEHITKEVVKADKIIDIGGANERFDLPTHILDIQPKPAGLESQKWIQGDACMQSTYDRFDDNEFDFAICTHTIEDVRDPLVLCQQLSRIAKAGYIECPSVYAETMMFSKIHEFVPSKMLVPNGYSHHYHITEPLIPNDPAIAQMSIVSPNYYPKGTQQAEDDDILLLATPKMLWVSYADFTPYKPIPGYFDHYSYYGLLWCDKVTILIQSNFFDEKAETIEYLRKRRDVYQGVIDSGMYNPLVIQSRFKNKFQGASNGIL